MNPSELTPEQVAGMLGQISSETLASLPHSLLYQARNYVPKEKQKDIAKYEHRAFARESVSENPLMALSLLPAIPAYQLSKLIDPRPRSGFDPSQILESFVGVGEGLKNAFLSKD